MITVEQVLKAKPDHIITIGEGASVQDALELMVKHGISSLIVMSEDKLTGILSERDYIRKAAPKRIAPWDIVVSDIMTRKVITVNMTDSIDTCMNIMCTNGIRHLPVMNKDKLVGMLSITDVIQALTGRPENQGHL